jgi:hypothetical protein
LNGKSHFKNKYLNGSLDGTQFTPDTLRFLGLSNFGIAADGMAKKIGRFKFKFKWPRYLQASSIGG